MEPAAPFTLLAKFSNDEPEDFDFGDDIEAEGSTFKKVIVDCVTRFFEHFGLEADPSCNWASAEQIEHLDLLMSNSRSEITKEHFYVSNPKTCTGKFKTKKK